MSRRGRPNMELLRNGGWLLPTAFSSFRADGEAVSEKPQNVSQRAELYNFFDQLPIEDLLQLRVPLEWVLKVTRRGDA